MLWGLSLSHLGTEKCFPLSKPFQGIFHILSANSQTLIVLATIGLLRTCHLLRTLLVTMSMDATAAASASASALSIEGFEKVIVPVFESISLAAAKSDVLGESVFDKIGRVDHVRSKLSLEEYARKKIARARTFSGDKAAMRMFENELTNLKRLRHHHLVTFVGSYTDPRYIGMLTTPVAECDLQQLLQSAPSNPSLLRQFFGCLCSAVQYLHSQKCRHKDIKPGNILVRKGTVFLTDFGTALNWSDRSGSSTGGTTGPFTPRFTAPEVFKCERRNESSDIWSLGCVYLDILVSFFPFSTVELAHSEDAEPVYPASWMR